MATSEYSFVSWLARGKLAHFKNIAMLAARTAPVAAVFRLKLSVGHLDAHAVCIAAEIGQGFAIPQVIGDFPEKEARQFTKHTLTRAGINGHLTDDVWHEIYEVMNGSRQGLAKAILLFILPGADFDGVLQFYPEHWRMELCHFECRYAVEMLASFA